MKPKKKVLAILAKGPIKSGDIIVECGYDPFINHLDRAIGTQSRQSWDGSQEQKALEKLVEFGKILYRRDRTQDVWYLLPGQEIPEVEGRSIPSFKSIVLNIYEQLPAKWVDLSNANKVDSDTAWHEFLLPKKSGCDGIGVTLTLEGNGVELADGDPICNWCFNTFTELYPWETLSSETIAKRIVKENKRLRKGWLKEKKKWKAADKTVV